LDEWICLNTVPVPESVRARVCVTGLARAVLCEAALSDTLFLMHAVTLTVKAFK
jgi:hypothetical protein